MDSMHSIPSMYYDNDAHVKGELLDCDEIPKRLDQGLKVMKVIRLLGIGFQLPYDPARTEGIYPGIYYHGPSDAMHNPSPAIKVKSLCFLNSQRFNTTAGNPVKKILLKLNLSDHRLFKMVVEVPGSSCLTRSITTCSYPTDKHKVIMKAQNGYEHVGPEVASPQGGKVTRWHRDCAWLMISRCSRSLCQIQVQGTSSIQEVNDHYNIFTRESQEYELKTKDKA
ncbi:hypothetical protein Tco_1341339 [Tanacetum coccineum]